MTFKLPAFLTKAFYKKQVKDFFQILSTETHYSGIGMYVRIKLIRKTTRFGMTDEETEIVIYDNCHRRSDSNVFWTFCPYTHDKQYMAKNNFNHDGYGYLINEDSTKHSFIKLSKHDIESAIDTFWERTGVTASGNWAN